MSKASQPDVRQPDVVQSTLERAWEVIERNRTLILAAIALFVIAGVAYAGWESYQASNEMRAHEDLFAVEKEYNKIKEGFDKSKMESMMAGLQPKQGKDKADQPAAQATEDLQKDYGTIVSRFEDVAQKHPGTAAAAQAAIYAANLYTQYGQPEKAADVLAAPSENLSSNNLLYGLTNLMLGNAQASQGQCDKAVQTWQRVVSSEANQFLHGDATVKMGICYENLNQPEKAEEMYKKASTDFADTSAGQTAKSLLRLLEIKPKPVAAQG